MEADDGLSGAGACDALAHLTDDERKRYACAPFLDEPACSEFRAALRAISDLRGQLRAVRGEHNTLRLATRALVEKLEAIEAHPGYPRTWFSASLRGVPNWKSELAAVRDALGGDV